MPFVAPTELAWLYVDFNSYFASVEQQRQPHLRGKPVAVVPVETDSTCAIAASYEAKAFGIKTGTPIYKAKKMCPDLICVLGRHQDYRMYHDRILAELDRHIPVTAVCSIDEMACKLARNERSLMRVHEMAQAIKAGLADNVGAYVRCSIGIAPNKYLAKVATDMQKPDGLVILQPKDIPDILRPLPLREFPGIGPGMERRLNRVGIYDTKTLLSLSPKHMRAVWGNVWGEKMWYMLRGYDVPDLETQRSTVGHSHVLAPEVRSPHEAFQIARRLTAKAVARLRRMGYVAAHFSLSVRLEAGGRIGLECKCKPSQDSFYFLTLLQGMWREMIVDIRTRRLKKVSVTLWDLTPDNSVQRDLFDPPENMPLRSPALMYALDHLNQRFGKDAVMLGQTRRQGKSFTGTKIAFTRIPDAEEFHE